MYEVPVVKSADQLTLFALLHPHKVRGFLLLKAGRVPDHRESRKGGWGKQGHIMLFHVGIREASVLSIASGTPSAYASIAAIPKLGLSRFDTSMAYRSTQEKSRHLAKYVALIQ